MGPFFFCQGTVGRSYCWWKKSCTSWYGKYPIIFRVSYIPGGAGFQPSTVPVSIFCSIVFASRTTMVPCSFCHRSWTAPSTPHTRRLVGCRWFFFWVVFKWSWGGWKIKQICRTSPIYDISVLDLSQVSCNFCLRRNSWLICFVLWPFFFRGWTLCIFNEATDASWHYISS